MHKRHTQRKGFTLVELMVAVSILGIMLFLINELFQTTSTAVTTSVQQSKSIAGTRLIGEQIKSDTDAMLGPGDPNIDNEVGYLVIIQRRVRDVPLQDPTNLAEFTTEFIRSDQLVFIRDALDLRSMTPQSNDSFGTNLVGQAGDYARVWYGHGQRTANDGSISFTGNFRLGGSDAGFDRIGSDWILGRQAMLFNPTDEGSTAADQRISAGPYISAAGPNFDDRVNGVTGYTGPQVVFAGLSDVTRKDYLTLSPGNQPTGASSQRWHTTLVDDLTTGNNNTYLSTAFPSTNALLRVNPSPTETGYQSWSIAQTHGILSPNCSDFVVQFAADLNGNGRLDTTANNDLGGDILWYDGFNTNPSPPINWNLGWGRIASSRAQPFVNLDANARAFIFRLDDDAALDPDNLTINAIQQRSMWPYLIRIRYRLHGNRGRLAGNDPAALIDGVDNDGDQGQPGGGVDEPGEDQIPGQWFEHIIRVPRP